MAKIEREEIDTSIERKIILGMIVSKHFLRELAPIFDVSLLSIPYARTVATWCIEHWLVYGEAPEQKITDIYNSSLRQNKIPKSERDILDEFLNSLSKEWEGHDTYNVEFWLDEAVKYLDSQRLLIIAEDMQALLSKGDVKAARELTEGYNRVKRGGGGAVNPFEEDIIVTAFEESIEPLFSLPGEVGHLFNPLLTRGSLIGVMAPEKRGKTHLLTDLAIYAVKKKRNVVFFAVGDMTRDQMVRRLGSRLTGRQLFPRFRTETIPVYDCQKNQRGNCPFPRRCEGSGKLENEDGNYAPDKEHFEIFQSGVEYTPCSYCRREDQRNWRGARWWETREVKRMTVGNAKRAGAHFMKRQGDRLRLYEYGYGEINIREIAAELERLHEQEDFLADVVIIDYADNLGPEDSRVTEERHKQNQTWGAMSSLRKRLNNCIISATQTDAASYAGDDITMSNFTEDKRKLGHVTGMIAINQTSQEKKEGLARLGIVVAREMDFHMDRQVVVLQNLGVGRSILGSYRKR